MSQDQLEKHYDVLGVSAKIHRRGSGGNSDALSYF